MKATGSASHDGAEAAFCASGKTWSRVGDADGVLVNVVVARRRSMSAIGRGTSDADLFGGAVGSLTMLGNGSEELGLDIFGELEADGVVEVVVAIANVARVGPGRLRLGGRTAEMSVGRTGDGGGGEPRGRVAVVLGVGSVAIVSRLDGTQRDIGRETTAPVWKNFERSGPVSQQRPPAVQR